MIWNDMAGKYIRDYMQTKDVMRWFDQHEAYRRHIDPPKLEGRWVLDAISGDFICAPTIISEVVVPESDNEQLTLPPLEEIL